MCNAFCCLVTKSKKVYWKAGVDSHDQLQTLFVKKDKKLKDDKKAPGNTFARIEIVPKDGNYLNPKQNWVFKIDEQVKPKWLDKSYERPCYSALKLWQEKVYSQIDLKGLKHLVHPFKIKPPKNITTGHLKLLAVWASVRASVGDSVGTSVGVSVRASIGTSVWDSVRAYYGTFFPKIQKWQYCSKVKEKGYPFKSAVKLWKMGLVASYSCSDNKWRLHGGKDAKVLWEGTKADLKKYLPKGWK